MKKYKSSRYLSLSTINLVICAFFIGILAGFGAVIFRNLINFMHNMMFSGSFSFLYDVNLHTVPSIWGIGVILLPVLGGLAVTWLIENVSQEAKGHGVSEVIYAIHYKKGEIPLNVAFAQAFTSAISIGSGGSVGREGPIIQIGSALGSFMGQWLKVMPSQRIIMVAAGGAAGLAATFNAPLGGMLFALELLLISIDETSICLVTISTITATFIGYLFLGMDSVLTIPWHFPSLSFDLLLKITLLFIPFGIIMGFASALFVFLLNYFDELFHKAINNPYLRHSIGMLFVGVLMYLFMYFFDHYYIEGLGYSTIIDVLYGALYNPWFLTLLFIGKLLATCLTLGSGGAGGVFLPSLVLGAVAGGAYGNILKMIFLDIPIDPIAFAIAGMAGMVGGTTGAVIMAMVITMEITMDYSHVLPIMVTVALSYNIRAYLCPQSIYTFKLFRKGMNLVNRPLE